MNIFWYFPTFIMGFLGTLALARSTDKLFIGEGLMPIQFGIAALFLFLGWKCLKIIRSKTSK